MNLLRFETAGFVKSETIWKFCNFFISFVLLDTSPSGQTVPHFRVSRASDPCTTPSRSFPYDIIRSKGNKRTARNDDKRNVYSAVTARARKILV